MSSSSTTSFSEYVLLVDCSSKPLPRSKVKCMYHTKTFVETIRSFPHRLAIPDEKRENDIESIWKERIKLNPHLFNGTKFRLSSIKIIRNDVDVDDVDDENIAIVEINVGETDYKSFVGTNLANDYESIPEKSLANPLGTAIFTICKDEKVLCLKRSEFVGEASGLIVLPGGHPEPQNVNVRPEDTILDVTFELFDSASLELLEETGLEVSKCEKLLFLGISRRTVNKRSCAVFFTRTSMTSSECIEKYHSEKPLSAEESTEMLALTFDELAEAAKNDKCPGCHCGAITLGLKYLSFSSTSTSSLTKKKIIKGLGGLGDLKKVIKKNNNKINNDSLEAKERNNDRIDQNNKNGEMEQEEIDRARENLQKLALAAEDAKIDEAINRQQQQLQLQQQRFLPPNYGEFSLDDIYERSADYMACNAESGLSATMRKDELHARALKKFPILSKMLDTMPTLKKVVSTPNGMNYFLKTLHLSTKGDERGEDNFSLFANYPDLSSRVEKEIAHELDLMATMQRQFREFKYSGDSANMSEQPRETSAEEDLKYALERSSKIIKRSNKAFLMHYFRSMAPRVDYLIPFLFMYVLYLTSLVPGINLLVVAVVYVILQVAKGRIDQIATNQSNVFYAISKEAIEKLGPKQALDAQSPRLAMWFHGLLGITLVHFLIFIFPKYKDIYAFEVYFGLINGLSCPLFFLLTYVVGPGYVPRVTDTNDKNEWMRNMKRVVNTYASIEDGETNDVAASATQMSVNGRFCASCHTSRPLRSKHCPICQRCVYKMDHHCPITLTCIGAKNQKWFFLSLLSCFIAAIVFVRLDWKLLCDSVEARRLLTHADEHPFASWFKTFNSNPMSTILFVLQILGGIAYAGILLVRQIFCAISQLTTNEMNNSHRYEYLREGKDELDYYNPFDRGLFVNFKMYMNGHEELNMDWDFINKEERNKNGNKLSLTTMRALPRYSYSRLHKTSPLFCIFHTRAQTPADEDGTTKNLEHSRSHNNNSNSSSHHGHSHSGVPCSSAEHAV